MKLFKALYYSTANSGPQYVYFVSPLSQDAKQAFHISPPLAKSGNGPASRSAIAKSSLQ